MKLQDKNLKLTAKEMSRIAGSEELMAHVASGMFHDQNRVTNKPEIDMAYWLGHKEALQKFARLLKNCEAES